MKNKPPGIFVLVLAVTLAGCHRLATTPTVDLSRFTPQPSETAIEGLPATGATSEFLLDPVIEEALRLYPLWVGSSWVYEYMGFDENVEVIWRVIETVVATEIVEGYYVAKLEREAQVIEGIPPVGFRGEPETGTFWYLIEGNNLYRFDTQYHTILSEAWLELILPLPEAGEAWYPNPGQRAVAEPGMMGSRYASEPFQSVLPMGGTYTCYHVAVQYDDKTLTQTFCENVGFVYEELTLDDLRYGYRSELKGFLLQ